VEKEREGWGEGTKKDRYRVLKEREGKGCGERKEGWGWGGREREKVGIALLSRDVHFVSPRECLRIGRLIEPYMDHLGREDSQLYPHSCIYCIKTVSLPQPKQGLSRIKLGHLSFQIRQSS